MQPPQSLSDIRSGIDVPVSKFSSLPDWLDRSRFAEGQLFFRKFFLAVTFSYLCALLVGFVVPSLAKALVHTGNSDGAEKSRKRYLQTLRHLSLWHLSDVLSEESAGGKSLSSVRNWHDKVRFSMDSTVMSQYDMALVQSGFIGPIILYPHQLGIEVDKHELGSYVEFWRVIGHLLGIDDNFNICGCGLEEARKICKEIEQEVIVPGLSVESETYRKLSSDFVSGFKPLFPWLSLELIHAFIFPYMGLKPPPLSYVQSVFHWLLWVFYRLYGTFPWLREFFNARAWSMYRSMDPDLKLYIL